MTNHTEKNKAYVNATLEYLKESRERLNTAECSYCTRDASQFEFFDQRNFVPIQGKVDEQGNQAYAIYGDCCLNDARKVQDIKRAFVVDARGNGGYVPLYSLQSVEDYEEIQQDIQKRRDGAKAEVAQDETKTDSIPVQKETVTGEVKPTTVKNVKEFPATVGTTEEKTSEAANKGVINTVPEKAENKEDDEPSLLEKLRLKKDNKNE